MDPGEGGKQMEGPAMSIIVPSFQRRISLMRLVDRLDDVIDANDRVEVVIVLDGSTDGSQRALERADVGFDLRWHWQKNAGRSAARNIGVTLARGEICWLVDDDMTVDRAALNTHLAFHESVAGPSVLLGPQWEVGGDTPLHRGLARRIERLTEAGCVTNPFDFWTGSFSAPRQTLLDVGGFDEAFRGWGGEDVELGFRLTKHGVPIRFDEAAGGRHWRVRGARTSIREERELGRNLVRLCDAHPEALGRILPAAGPIVDLHRRNVRSPRIYGLIAATAELLLRYGRVRSSRQGARLLGIGISAARLAGLIEAGGSERLQNRYTVKRQLFLNRPAEAIADHGSPSIATPRGCRAEYEETGVLRRCVALADSALLAPVSADAPWFAAAVAENHRRKVNRVPYAFTSAIRKIACDRSLVRVVEEVLGDDRWVAWGANLQIGTPNDAYQWHTDIESVFWPTLTVAVGIAGCRDDNATRYIAGSHRLRVGPGVTGDPCDEELVLATAHKLDARCNSIVSFEGFVDGSFSVFDARGWHRGDTEASADRLVLFLHYQRADEPRIPYMRDYTQGTWFEEPAAYMPNPRLGHRYEHAVHSPPSRPPSRRRRAIDTTRARLHVLGTGVARAGVRG